MTFRRQSTTSSFRASFIDRRTALLLCAGIPAAGGIAACGGGGDASSEQAPSTQTIYGEPTGLFSATASSSSVAGYAPFAVSTNARSKPYDYLAVAYIFSDTPGDYIVDYPPESAPGQLELYAPLGKLSSGTPTRGTVRLVVVRIIGDSEELSNVINLTITEPATSSIPASALAATLLAATGLYRQQVVDRSFGLNPLSIGYTSLSNFNTQLYSSSSANSLQLIASNPQEELILRQALTALFTSLALSPDNYIVRRTGITKSTPDSRRTEATLGAVTTLDALDEFTVNLQQLTVDLANRARAEGALLKEAGSLIALGGAIGLIGVPGSAIAAAAVGTGAIMAATGIGFGLVEGGLLDNLTSLGGLTTSQRLNVRSTLGFWTENVTGYFMPTLTKRYVPTVTSDTFTGPLALRDQVGAFLYETGRTAVVSKIATAANEAINNNINLNLPEAWANRVESVSFAWNQWRASRFSTMSFPASLYNSTYTPPAPSPIPAPTPSPAPSPAPPYTCTDCAYSFPRTN